MKIIIGGDVAPTKNNIIFFENGKMDSFISPDLLSFWDKFDFRIFNLETPLCKNISPIKKSGPCLFSSEECIKGISKLNPNLICLANNHIMDQNSFGYITTVEALSKAKVKNIGSGSNKKEINKQYIIKCDNFNIGVYNCCDTEFNVFNNNKPCSNCFNPLESFDDLVELKKICKYIIVIFHAGKEYYRYPSPYLQNVCHIFADKGANLVLCQHSHCIGSLEKYKDCNILYGQGNYIFTNDYNEFWKDGLLVSVNVDINSFDVEYIPIVNDGNNINICKAEEKKAILNGLYKRSNNIKKIGFIEKEYSNFSKKQIYDYLNQCNGNTFLKKILRKIFGIRRMYTSQDLLNIQNILQCDAHRELFLEALKEMNIKGDK